MITYTVLTKIDSQGWGEGELMWECSVPVTAELDDDNYGARRDGGQVRGGRRGRRGLRQGGDLYCHGARRRGGISARSDRQEQRRQHARGVYVLFTYDGANQIL